MAQIELRNCNIAFVGGGNNQSIIIKVGEGTLSYSEKVNRRYVKNRGVLDLVLEGEEEPVDVRLNFVYDFVTSQSGGPITPVDALKKINGAVNWSSSSVNTSGSYSIDIVVTDTVNCANQIETTTLKAFRYETIDFDLKEGMITVTGKCNVTSPTVNHT